MPVTSPYKLGKLWLLKGGLLRDDRVSDPARLLAQLVRRTHALHAFGIGAKICFGQICRVAARVVFRDNMLPLPRILNPV